MSVDLIYLDPPFNSNATYDVLSKKGVAQGPPSGPAAFQVFPAAQITAFEDTWQWSMETEAVYKEVVTGGPRKLADLMQALQGPPFGDTMCSVDRTHPQGQDVYEPRGTAVAVPPYAEKRGPV